MTNKKQDMEVYNILKKLNINYEELAHQAVYTIEEALNENIPSKIEGIECKNLFVKSKSNYYLIFIEASKRANLKELATKLNETKLSFASEKELKEILNLEVGSVTPLGIINDIENKVTVLLDKTLENTKVLIHPNVNTKTISIEYDDLIKIINYTNHNYQFF